jgi:hypothetical protein
MHQIPSNVLHRACIVLPRELRKLRRRLHPWWQDHSVVPFWEGRRVSWSLHFRFMAELILHQIDHFLHQNVIILHSRSCTVPRIWESVNSAIIHNFVVAPTVHVLLQPVAGWSYLVSGIGWYSRRTECHLPICRLIWVRLLNWLTCIAL